MQMTRLIDQLLTLARADAGVEVLRFEPINLPDLIQESADEWSDRFEARIQFACEVDPPEFWVDADYLALKRLLNILLENAWRYTPASRPATLALHATSSATRGLAPLSLAEISVTDTGLGIAPDDQRKIFDRFYRAARPLRGEFAGSGLGHVLAQWIAERHAATIYLRSAPGQGSRFSLRLQLLPSAHRQKNRQDCLVIAN
jgi:signal transduction histidine kinase